MLFPVVILAGGLATRLHPLTSSIPKSLINVEGKPFIFWQLDYLKKQGINEVIICIGFLGDMIKNALGNGDAFGLNISYSDEGNGQLGTGGALNNALGILPEEFFVTYGDSLLQVDFRQVQHAYKKSKDDILMTVYKNENRFDKSNIIFIDGKIIKYSKNYYDPLMAYIDYGLQIMSQRIIQSFPSNQVFDLGDIFFELSKQGTLSGFEVMDRFYEVGSVDGKNQTEQFLKENKNEFY